MTNLKWLSDTDMMTNGSYGVEWEYTDGHRHWECFDSEEERDNAIRINEATNEIPENKAYLEQLLAEQDEWLRSAEHEYLTDCLHSMLTRSEEDPTLLNTLTPEQLAQLNNYKTDLISKYTT